MPGAKITAAAAIAPLVIHSNGLATTHIIALAEVNVAAQNMYVRSDTHGTFFGRISMLGE